MNVHADDPATDYWAVREELRMYNPEYCARPHVVALNKMDLQDAAQLQEEIASEVLTMAHRIQVDHVSQTTLLQAKPLLPPCCHNCTEHCNKSMHLHIGQNVCLLAAWCLKLLHVP